jgi:hypothetical protein
MNRDRGRVVVELAVFLGAFDGDPGIW